MSWVCGAQRERWLKPGSIMPTSCLRSVGWSGNARNSPPIMCYLGVVNRLASFISLACLLLQCSVCY